MYDFTTILRRYDTGCEKWDEMKPYHVTDPMVVPLSNAEMEFANAPEIRAGLAEYVQSAVMSYFDPQPAFFETARAWLARRQGWDVPVEAIIPNPNLHGALNTAIAALTEPGDGVLAMTPVWPGFLGAIRRTGRRLIAHELTERGLTYSLDFDRLERELAEPDCRLLLICSPHNPLGKVWTGEELARIGELCLRHDVRIVSDEIHADLTFPGRRHIPIASLSPALGRITVTFTGASKAFNLAGLDTAVVVIPDPDLRERYLTTRKNRGIYSPNMLGLKALELAWTRGEQWLDECVEVIASNAELVKTFLRARIPEVDCTDIDATYLMWLDLRSIPMDPEAREASYKRDAWLFLDDGRYFGPGGEGFARMNIACPRAAVEAALTRLEKWVNDHKEERI